MIPPHGSDELLDPGGLDEIDADECWRLIGTQPVGRVAVIVDRYPLVFPVNFAVDGQQIIFRTGVGEKLWALRRSHVTFEVDELDPVHHAGWSVMLCGSAQAVDLACNPELAVQADANGGIPWAPGQRDRIVRVVADRISGRRIRPAELPPATDARGYA